MTADGSSGYAGRGRPLPPLRVAGVPVGASRGDRSRAQGPAGRDRHVDRRPDPRRARLGVHRRARHDPRPGQRLGVPVGGLRRDSDPDFDARITVPVLWDTRTERIVNNESADIIVMLNSAFDEFAANPELDLYPADLRDEIDAINETIYENVNNGVYRAGFASHAGGLRGGGVPALRHARRARRAPRRHAATSSATRQTLADWRLFTTLAALRPGLRRSLQVQPATDRRLPEPVRLPARPLPDAGRRGHRRPRPDQAPLLRDARRDQPHRDRPGGPRRRPRRPARPRRAGGADAG